MSSYTYTPPDQTERDRIRTDLEHSLFVNAGAGSGKTTALVHRVVEIIKGGHPIEKLAAITFTEAAASELKVRLRTALVNLVRDEADPVISQRAKESLEGLDSAAISTLHSFASRLLKQFPTEAGLPPAIEVLDPVDSLLEFQSNVADLFDSIWEDPELSRAMTRLESMGVRHDKFEALFKTLGENWDRIEDHPFAPAELTPLDFSAALVPLDEAIAASGTCSDNEDKLLVHLETDALESRKTLAEISVLSEKLEDATPSDLRAFEQTALSKAANLKIKCSTGQQGNWGSSAAEGKENKAWVSQLLKDSDELVQGCVKQAADEAARFLAAFAAERIVALASKRREVGRLEFHDLLVLARGLLRKNDSVRKVLSNQYRPLLLDEFQDTDPIQIELAMLLAAGDNARPKEPWNAQKADEGSVFFVGDPNQSIYRFRRADVQLYLSAQTTFQHGRCELSTNFRTVPGILDWVNETFATVLAGEQQAGLTPLVAAREPIESEHSPVTLLGGPIEGVLANGVRQISAKGVTDQIRKMIDDQWPVSDSDSTRPIRHSDICILVPARTGLPQLERALDAAGLPYRVDSSSLLWGTQAVKDLLRILAAIADPRDSLALVAALRTPVFGCGDDDLVRWRNGDQRDPSQTGSARPRRWSYLRSHTGKVDPEDRVGAAMARLYEWHKLRWWLRPDEMVDLVLREGRFFELALRHDRPQDHLRRLRFVSSAAAEFSDRRGGDLREFLRWSELQTADTVRVAEPRLAEIDDDAIRIMTIHSSKGLEFGACVLYGLSSGPVNPGRGAKVIWDENGEPEVSFSAKVRSSGFDMQITAEESMSSDERDRLLYVAATRARDWLVVSLSHKDGKGGAKTGAGRLLEAQKDDSSNSGDVGSSVSNWVQRVPDPTIEEVAESLAPAKIANDVNATLERQIFEARQTAKPFADTLSGWRAERSELLSKSRPSAISATAVAKLVTGADAHDDEQGLPVEPPEFDKGEGQAFDLRRGIAGTAIGSAVHDTLEILDFFQPEGLAQIAAAKAEEQGIGSHAEVIAKMVSQAINSELITSFRDAKLHKELYVAAPMGDTVGEGYIDLLVQRSDGSYVLVDYKTDAARSAKELDEKTELYRLQLATYALLLERSVGITVDSANLLFVSADRAVHREIADLSGAMQQATAVVGA